MNPATSGTIEEVSCVMFRKESQNGSGVVGQAMVSIWYSEFIGTAGLENVTTLLHYPQVCNTMEDGARSGGTTYRRDWRRV